jgi:integrase
MLDAPTGRMVADGFLARMKTKSARVYLSKISAVFNRAIREWGLTCANPFASLDIRNEGRDAKMIEAFTLPELQTIASACIADDTEVAWICAMQMATGARVQEISRLRVTDLRLDGEIPHIKIREHYALGRGVKTQGSERDVPLVGIGLWAAGRALSQSGAHRGWLFHLGTLSSDGAGSDRVGKWLTHVLPGSTKRSHSLRHAAVTRMTVAGASQDIIDEIVGHAATTKSKVAAGYAHGYPLAMLRDALALISLPAPE